MSLFYLTVSNGNDDPAELRTLLVIADTESAARTLVPEDMSIESVSVRGASNSGPPRLIGWMKHSLAISA